MISFWGVRWTSLIADREGEIEQEKLRSIVAIILGCAGGVAVYWAMTARYVPRTEIVMIGVAALVAPLTGAKVADTLASWRLGKDASARLKDLKVVGEETRDVGVENHKLLDSHREELDRVNQELQRVNQVMRNALTAAGLPQPPQSEASP